MAALSGKFLRPHQGSRTKGVFLMCGTQCQGSAIRGCFRIQPREPLERVDTWRRGEQPAERGQHISRVPAGGSPKCPQENIGFKDEPKSAQAQ